MKQRESTLLEFLRIIICDGAVCVIANAFHTKNEAEKVIVCIRTLARTHAFYYRGKALCIFLVWNKKLGSETLPKLVKRTYKYLN